MELAAGPGRSGWWIMLIEKYGEWGIIIGIATLATFGFIVGCWGSWREDGHPFAWLRDDEPSTVGKGQ